MSNVPPAADPGRSVSLAPRRSGRAVRRVRVGLTMYAAVAYRTREIGTLRALGFSRVRIVSAFLVESMALALIGGAIGCILALPVHGISTGALNMTSFTELAFKFRITPALLGAGMVFS